MSDNEGRSQDKTKRQRACDICRRHKIRCDPPASQDESCARCIRLKLECTFMEESKKRTTPKGYIAFLEERCRKLESLVKQLSPTTNLDVEIGPSYNQQTWRDAPESKSKAFAPGRRPGQTSQARATLDTSPISTIQTSPHPPLESEPLVLFADALPASLNVADDNGAQTVIEEEFGKLHLDKEVANRFHDTSSGVSFVHAALGEDIKSHLHAANRPRFWRSVNWRKLGGDPTDDLADIEWPPEDLAPVLTEAFFDKGSLVMPIIHRPTFVKNLQEGLHLQDLSFAKLALMVYAMGSRMIDDPRTCCTDENGQPDWSSAGWKYFTQVTSLQEPLFKPANLSNLQAYAIACFYLPFVEAPHVGWLVSGIALRFATDVGLHREKVYPPHHPLESQFWKRTFWALLAFDILLSCRLGRPAALSLDEIDATLPLEKDEEFYDEATQVWIQPEDKPARISGFVNWVKAQIIMSKILRRVYNVPNPPEEAITELDDVLTNYLHELPPHLRWEFHKNDVHHLLHSAVLRLSWLANRIMLHRRFLTVMSGQRSGATRAAESLAVCTAAAQASVRVFESANRISTKAVPISGFAFASATILLVAIWDLKLKNPTSVDIKLHMEDVETCRVVLKSAERKWRTAGRLYDILTSLIRVQGLGQSIQHSTLKRTRDSLGDQTDDPQIGRSTRWRGSPSDSADSNPSPPYPTTFEAGGSSAQSTLPLLSLLSGVPDISSIRWHIGQMGQGLGMGEQAATLFHDQDQYPGGYASLGDPLQSDQSGIRSDLWQSLFATPEPTEYNDFSAFPMQNQAYFQDPSATLNWTSELAALGFADPQPRDHMEQYDQ